MTPQQIDAMKLAFEALEQTTHAFLDTEGSHGRIEQEATDAAYNAITALEEVLKEHAMRETQRLGQEIEQEPLEYWNAVEGWVKIDEVRKHFDSVGCATIYKTAGEGRVPLSLAKAQPEQEPEFFTHSVERPYDWSEWVCPDPKGYMMKCCDCGLVHDAEFSVVRYKSETERKDCDRVDDPNLQAVFRMRRSEQWSPEDTAHRAGGMPMAQPEQEPVAWLSTDSIGERHLCFDKPLDNDPVQPLFTTPPHRTWVDLTNEEYDDIWRMDLNNKGIMDKTIAKLMEKNA